MNLDQALETYVAESRELLEQMEEALLAFARGDIDEDRINAVFRAAHTIKGSAGLFGLDSIVSFTHVVESVLDRVREGALGMDGPLIEVLLACSDCMRQLVDVVSGGGVPGPQTGDAPALLARLSPYLQSAGCRSETAAPSVQGATADAGHWHVSLRFGADVLRNGMDPISFIRYLATIGDIVSVTTLPDAMPAAEAMDAESCYLGFEIGIVTAADERTIEDVFEFVREDCSLRILPPHSKAADYVELIRALPEDDSRLGEVLVGSGAVTASELAAALAVQRSQIGAADADAPVTRLGEILVTQDVVHESVVQAALDKQKHGREAKTQEARFIRLDAEKLDRLINQVGELVIAGAGIGLAAKRVGAVELLEAASTLEALVEGVRDSALQLRMVPIGATFNRFQRVVHDVAQELQKDIGLVIQGAETELDKTMVDRIGDPLTHLVRNAMDHGIERTEARVAAGKPGKGTVTLNAYHESGSIVIEVTDDGGGLDRARILAKGVERGLVAADAQLSDPEVFALIFEPGFSTASRVSNLSGRGVGMDVVKRSVSDLRGTVEVDSRPGVGTTVRIRLPLTLAIIDGFLVAVGRAVFIVPLDLVEECVEITAQDRSHTGDRDFINLRGQALPFVELRQLFDIGGQRSPRENVLVVRSAGRRVGLVVDHLIGEAQTVIKPLGAWFRQVKGIGGSTIMSDGRVALILDVPGLLDHVHRVQTHRHVLRPAA
jgi:two-component system chemotaxis sensor kinase CheA